VRFIGNRSSGRMGAALADECVRRGWSTTLLLGPVIFVPQLPGVHIIRFRTTLDLQSLLRTHVPQADVLVMAAAVADYRPKVDPSFFGGKFRRKNENLTLELEPTPDLLAEVAQTRRQNQLFVGFALEPREEMLEAAQAKMRRKRIDMVVANPLETMDSDEIQATVLFADGSASQNFDRRPKAEAAPWLCEIISRAWQSRTQPA
jgi:phosphopantothenoylcysteine decarboxylase / phosphopantothenate---cysteine ligase